jgi:uncharacterized damage-inducible protein DinB
MTAARPGPQRKLRRMPRPPLLEPLYRGWEADQQKLLDSLRPLTLEQMQLRAAPHEWAIWQLASNMAGGRLYWLCFMLGEDRKNTAGLFEPQGWEDTPDHPRSAAELEDAFRRTWEVASAAIDRWSLEDLQTPVTKNDWWGRPQTFTPMWVLHRIITHEAHHGAEISLILRVHGLPTLLNM